MSKTKAALMDGRLQWPTETTEEEARREAMDDIAEAQRVGELDDRTIETAFGSWGLDRFMRQTSSEKVPF